MPRICAHFFVRALLSLLWVMVAAHAVFALTLLEARSPIVSEVRLIPQ